MAWFQPELTQELLKLHLHYEPETGVFTWIRPRAKRVKKGDRAGSVHEGYWAIKIFHRRYPAARVAFLYMTGRWPSKEVDHRDRNPLNDAWGNLREASRSQNCCNKRVRNKTGFIGVTEEKSGKFKARVKLNGVRTYLGLFNTAGEAADAVMKAKREKHREFSVDSPVAIKQEAA